MMIPARASSFTATASLTSLSKAALVLAFAIAAALPASESRAMTNASPESRAMTIASSSLSIDFSSKTGGITRITALPERHEFIRAAVEKPLLWRVTFHDSSGKEVSLDNGALPPPAARRSGETLTLRWDGAGLPDDPGVLDIRVACRLASGGDTAFLRLWVVNRSRRHGLWSIRFPVLAPLGEKGSADIAVGRGNWGQLFRRAVERVSGTYPSHDMPMQFMVAEEEGGGLYLAAHDPKARFKTFDFDPGGEFGVGTWAEGMGVPGGDWSAPYPFALGVVRGGWMEGCKRYRAWALRSAPWTRRGPLSRRADVPESIRNVAAWVQGSGAREEAVPAIREFARRLGAPAGTHWYNWHKIPFDTDYPAYLPAKSGFAEGVKELRNDGVVVMPYINARLWDIANAEFGTARPYTVKNERGEPAIEEYGSGAKLAVMCPTQAFWRERVREIVRRLVEEEGVNAVYLDQIASAAPRLCFDASHGHPIGSGSWWVDGYREMLSSIRRWAAAANRSVALTTENNAEPYMDEMDGFLVWTPRDENEIPMIAAVYGGYALYFGSNRALEFGDVSYCLLQAREFTWGAQLGWDGAGLLAPEHRPKMEFLSRLARLRARSARYLVYGELVELPRPVSEIPVLEGTWNGWKGNLPVRLPAVQAALWKGRDGSAGLVVANADTKAHEVRFRIDADRYRIGRTSRWSVTRVTTDGTAERSAAEGRVVEVTAVVPARDGLLLVLRPR